MSNQALAVTNFDKIKALANDQTSIERFAQVLGSRTQAHAFVTQAIMAVTQSPDLQECKPASVLNCVMRAATMQLSLDPSLGQCYPVPFNDHKKGKIATLIVGWRGIRQMALRTGKYRFINTSELYEGQELVVDQLTGETRLQGSRTSAKVIGYFNFFRLLSGFESVLYMTVEELQAHGQKYAGKNPKWKTDFPAMAKKTVTRLNLLRNGYIDPVDRTTLEELDDEVEAEGDVIDSEFSEADDARAEELARSQKQAASSNRKSADQILNELNPDWGSKSEPAPASAEPETIDGEFEDQAPAPAAAWTNTVISLEIAQSEKASDGALYWGMKTEDLVNRLNTIQKTLDKNHMDDAKRDTYLLKRDVIRAILEHRATNQPPAEQDELF
jgi:recombination protein RecT